MNKQFGFALLTFLTLVYFHGQSFSQCASSISLNSQSDVDNFSTNHPDCASQGWVNGLSIKGADIVDLSGLNSIVEVTNQMTIRQTSLTDLSTLTNLKKVLLLNIDTNPLLTEVSGFENSLNCERAQFLYCPELTTISGFNNMVVCETINFLGCPKLANISGLSNCVEIFQLFIDGSNLIDLNQFTSLEAVTHFLTIQNNLLLTDISKLSSLKFLSDITIDNNPLLVACCELTTLKNQNKLYGSVRVNNNAIGCSSFIDILNSCLDEDSDGFLDSSDNCPSSSNPTQSDFDSDGIGDGCDNCPLFPNAMQTDSNMNGIGDACDTGQIQVGIRNDIGDIYNASSINGVVLKSINGLCYRIIINSEGGLETYLVDCP